MQTLSQKHMKIALECVIEVNDNAECAKIYKGLCQNFAVQVVQNGLMQAVMFHEAKKKSSTARGKAHAYLLQHVAKLIGVDDLSGTLIKTDALTYIGYTRTITGSWGFFKNYARSILPGGEPDA